MHSTFHTYNLDPVFSETAIQTHNLTHLCRPNVHTTTGYATANLADTPEIAFPGVPTNG